MDTVGGWLSEIRFFYRRQSLRPLSANGQVLWHYLMYRANEAFWQWPVRLSLMELAGGTRLPPTAVKRARRELVEAGYVLHEEGRGRQPAGYVMLSCVQPGRPMQAFPHLARRLAEDGQALTGTRAGAG